MMFFAYKNRWGSICTHPYDPEAEVEALKSPSVLGVARNIEASSLSEAERIAAERFREGQFLSTFAGGEATTGHHKDTVAGAEAAVKEVCRGPGGAAAFPGGRWK